MADDHNALQPIDLTGILEPYLNKWVALSSDQSRVLASGTTPKEVLDDAKRQGEAHPILMLVPAVSGPYVLSA